MHRRIGFVSLALGFALMALVLGHAAEKQRRARPAEQKAFGIDKRVPWTSSRVRGSPDPPSPYRTELAFPKLPKFDEPLDLNSAPGVPRLFVVERYGRIYSIRLDPETDKADLLIDM